MKKLTLLFTLLIATYFSTKAQNIATDTSAPFVAYWKKGEKKTFTITKKVEKTESSKIISTASNTCTVSVTVKDSTAEGYTLEWNYKYPQQAARIAGFEFLLNGLKVIYKTDDVGSFKELVNYDEIKMFLDKSLKAFASTAKDTTGMTTVMSQVKKVFSSRESVEQLLLREVSLYHTPYGVEYSINKTVTETELPNFIGGDPWPALLTMRLSGKPSSQIAQAVMDMEIDKVKAAENIKTFLVKTGQAMGKEVPESELPSYLEIKDRYQFDMVLKTGWIKTASVKRIANYGGKGKIETTTVQMN
jgi:hypothetical protein